MPKLFNEPKSIFIWRDIKTFLLRNQYNETLTRVVEEYFTRQYTTSELPSFLNVNDCLTLAKFDEKCSCAESPITISASTTASPSKKEAVEIAQKKFDISVKEEKNVREKLIRNYKIFEVRRKQLTIAEPTAGSPIITEFNGLKKTIIDGVDASKRANALTKLLVAPVIGTNYDHQLLTELALLIVDIKNYEDKHNELAANQKQLKSDIDEFEKAKTEAEFHLDSTKMLLDDAEKLFRENPTDVNLRNKENAEVEYQKAKDAINGIINAKIANFECRDDENSSFCTPYFYYSRVLSLLKPIKDKNGNPVLDNFFDFQTNSLTVGTALWLYYYERMGIFKILGALLDDYNYRGKYTLSGSRNNDYSVLMDMICTWHRLGISSNLRDRVCLYQRTLGVSIENNLGVDSERNTGFMTTFNKLLDYMLEYYKDKRLAAAINGGGQSRSSVATQTSIKDTMEALKQQLEPFQYGRNQINTFLGIATVHATICLLNNVRKEIGIPDQYERPQEFIPAAYDILVTKRAVTLNETNRFLVYDNCATYGYRILTDIETIDLSQIPALSSGGTFDLWLDDVEGWVEGYRNAYSTLPEKAEAIV